MSSSPRLNCGKCHSDLHLGKGGVLVLGANHQPDDDIRELQHKIRRFASEFPTGKVVTALAVFMVLFMAWRLFFGPAERLDSVAEEAARALASNNPAALESLAAEGTTDDVRRWYEAVHPRLDQLRAEWGGKPEAIKTIVTQENRDEQKGSAGVAIQPEPHGTRDVSLANPSEATASATVPFEQVTEWTLTRWGRWKLDGRATFARVPQSNRIR